LKIKEKGRKERGGNEKGGVGRRRGFRSTSWPTLTSIT